MEKPKIEIIGTKLISLLDTPEKIQKSSLEYKLLKLTKAWLTAIGWKAKDAAFKKIKDNFRSTCSGKNYFLRRNQLETKLIEIRNKLDWIEIHGQKYAKEALVRTLEDVTHDKDQAPDIYGVSYLTEVLSFAI